MSRKLILSALLVLLLIASGCRGILTPPPRDEQQESYIYVDEPIVLCTSRFISPIDTDPEPIVMENEYIFYEYTFDVTPIMDWPGRWYMDYELVYLMPSSCSENVSIYNFREASWDTIAYRMPGFITESGHLFSANGFEVERYVNARNSMRVAGLVFEPKLRAVRLNPRYFQVQMPEVDEAHVPTLIEYGLAFDGEAFWVISYWFSRIYRVSLSGEILDSFAAPYERPISITFDGENLWLSFPDLRIASVDTDGNMLCEFFLTDDSIFAGPLYLAWADGALWSVHRGPQLEDGCYFVRIDPEASCAAGEAVIEGEFASDMSFWISGLSWDGAHLWVLADSLHEYSAEGEYLAAYGLRVARPMLGLAWDGDTFWLMHSGPSALKARDKVISRFKIR
jgi:hypothetical protein